MPAVAVLRSGVRVRGELHIDMRKDPMHGDMKASHEQPDSAARPMLDATSLAQIVENVPIGICVVNSHLRLCIANDRARTAFHVTAIDAGQPLANLISASWGDSLVGDVLQHVHRAFAEGSSMWTSPAMPGRSDNVADACGDWHFRRIALSAVEFGVAWYLQDRHAASLLRDAQHQSGRRESEFLAVLAHELRNQLAPIRLSLELMKRAKGHEANRRALDIIDHQSQAMALLVDDLLDVSRIAIGAMVMRREKFRLDEVIAIALDGSQPLVREKSHSITVELPREPLWLEGDRLRLSQAFINLLNNAAKFTEAGGQITIAAELDLPNVTVHVRDTGLGIPKEQLERIFELFGRLERDRATHGLGIGLSLVRQVVSLHGGSVSAKSGGHRLGSDFVVCLPVASAAPSQPTPNPPVLRSSKSKRVLVVDDDAANRDAMARLLEALGHIAVVAASGSEALRLMGLFRPHVLLLDLSMPGVDGFEVARLARLDLDGSSVRIVAVTGHGQKSDLDRTRGAGFDAHLVKPVTLRQLEEALGD